MLEYFQNILNQVDPITAYVVLTLSAFAENVLPPVPGDTVVVFGAYLVSTGQLNFWGVYISTTVGSIAGFITMYYIGKKFGRSFIYKKSRSKYFKEEQIKKVEIWFGNWGYWVIVANRFLSGTRSVISLFAGLFHLNAFYVIILALLSALLWHALLITAGLLVGTNWELITEILSRYNQIFLILLFAGIIYFVIRKIRSKKVNPKD